jgi:hypothetical protein
MSDIFNDFVGEDFDILDILAHASYKTTEKSFIDNYYKKNKRKPSKADFDDFRKQSFAMGKEKFYNAAHQWLNFYVEQCINDALKQI